MHHHSDSRAVWIGLVTLILALASPGPVDAQSVEDFYRGKSLKLVVGSDATGEYDATARLLARHLGKHIPGRPNIIVQNMPGASGIKAANYLYSIAGRDGAVMATFNQGMPVYEATRMANTNFKTAEFNWIGTLTHSNTLVVVAARTGVKTIEDATKREVTMGSIGAGGTMSTHPILLNNALGTKFKLVVGYAGGQLVDMAIERGEVDGRGTYTWVDMKAKRAQWLRDKSVNILVQVGMEREPDLPHVPTLIDLARNDTERAVFTFISSDRPIGKSYVMPPQVPADRVEAIRKAFMATMNDRDFVADAKAKETEVHPIAGAELQHLVEKIVSTPPDIVQLAEQWMSEK
jgi:tripartite-type tricarboxylate transporter receptor subunit TctC